MTESQAAMPSSGPMTPVQVDRLAALDNDAWQAVYEQYFLRIRNFAYARTGDLALAEDIASETFAGALRGIGGYRDRGLPFGAWLFRIARNLTTDHLRRRGRRQEAALPRADIEASAGALGGIEDRDMLLRGIGRLTEEQQTLVALRFFSDMSLEETAAAMKKRIGAVKGLQQRALASLRRHLGADEAGL